METGSESKDFTEQSIVFNLHLKLEQLKGSTHGQGEEGVEVNK